jgi:multidrug efflux pump subunit AcrB/outer membrane protein TolC
MNPVKAALRHPSVVYLLTALICLSGVAALRDMPRREDPKITIRRGLVLAAYPGATTVQVEEQVTKRIEQRLFTFEEVRKGKTVSTSMDGGVIIDVALDDAVVDADRFWSKLRHEMNELSVTELPKGVLGPIVKSDFGDVIAVLLSVTGERYTPSELEVHLKTLETALLRIPAVSKVKRIGEQKERIYVTSSMQRVVQFGITPLHLAGALQGQNVIAPAGAIDAGQTRAPIRTSGLFVKEDEIKRQLVGMSPTGAPIYVGDVADVTRRQADPDFLVRAKGEPALMLTLEMRAGHNIVDFGREIDETIERVKSQLPPGVNVAAVVDQPKLVEERLNHFLFEFGLALVAVIAVTMILLPFPVAAVAATAIPVTVAMTFAMLRGLGIELHQVSLAALIVVLGMVVDDAIVIADNYVELLDEGVPAEEAAWRSATDLAVPVLAATLTIVAAFVPLAFLPGQMGEFMVSLPITVAIALANSYVVAMLLTPLLCRAFIKKGLAHAHEAQAAGKRKGPLDLMQGAYDWMIGWGMANRRMTMALGVLAVLAGLGLGGVVQERFFPPAERDEFAINVWMPEGTRLDATDAAVKRIERALAAEPEVLSYASFVGQGGPRFFFSFEPAFPRANIAQVIVRTSSVDATPPVVERLRAALPLSAPDAEIDVQRLTQGDPMWAPVEVRIAGPDVATLKEIGARVATVMEQTPGSFMVRNDYREDAYALEVELRPEVASRLGMTTTVVSNMLAGSFLGIPVSTFWEGDKSVDIVMRLDESHRSSFEDVGSTYVVSPMARMPLSGIADLRPVWQPGRIVHRNGVRTLTVATFAKEGILPSEVFNRIKPVIDTLTLPQGYDIAFGGENEIQSESFGHLSVGMLVGMLMIFLILVFQFQSIKDALVVMVAIPLALFGAFAGLLVTGNPFGFTAFMGLISLSGVVVRNAIILIDYIHEVRGHTASLEAAALEAGRRRLRPIFLTTVAAAAGLTPMILSGSGLWSPLASVIAVGLIFSMVFTLVVVPVLYVMVTPDRVPAPEGDAKPLVPHAAVSVLLLVALTVAPRAAGAQDAPTPRQLTLEQAIELAWTGNAPLGAVREKVKEMERTSAVVFSNFLPRFQSQAMYLASNNTQGILLPRGSLGYFPELGGRFPRTDRNIPQGGTDIFLGFTTVVQPVTHYFKIREGVAAARSDEDIARAGLSKAEQEVAFGVLRAYAGLLIAQLQRDVARTRVNATEQRMRIQTVAVTSGTAIDVSAGETRVKWLQARQDLLEREGEAEDVAYQLIDAIGLPAGTTLELTAPSALPIELHTKERYVELALLSNPDVREARAIVAKAGHGVGAARADYIPEVGLMGVHLYQNSIPFFPQNTLMVGVQGRITLLDFGARRAALSARRAQESQAERNLAIVESRVRGEVEAAYRKALRAQEVVVLATEALAVRTEGSRLRVLQSTTGYGVSALEAEAAADKLEAEMDFLRAQLGHRIAVAELEKAAGTFIVDGARRARR